MAETSFETYGSLLRAAFVVLHGGQPEEPAQTPEKRPGESLEDYLARTRHEALEGIRTQAGGVSPPKRLQDVHQRLLRLLQCAIEADAALAAQVRAYGCADFQGSIVLSERVHELVAESVRLDRELILALQSLEQAESGTLAALGLAHLLASILTVDSSLPSE